MKVIFGVLSEMSNHLFQKKIVETLFIWQDHESTI